MAKYVRIQSFIFEKKAQFLLTAFILFSQVSMATLKVGLVLDKGGKDDKSFNTAAYEGALKAEKDLKIENVIEKSNISEDDFINDLKSFSSRISSGMFNNTSINCNSKNNNFEIIKNNLNTTTNDLAKIFKEITHLFDKYQKNDFTVQIESKQNEELKILIDEVNIFII